MIPAITGKSERPFFELVGAVAPEYSPKEKPAPQC